MHVTTSLAECSTGTNKIPRSGFDTNIELKIVTTSENTGTIIPIVKPTSCTNVSNLLNLFWNDTLHVSDGLSVRHQEFKTVHTATGICQTVNPEMGKITSERAHMLYSSVKILWIKFIHSLVILPIAGFTV